jgi:hypothetical protein
MIFNYYYSFKLWNILVYLNFYTLSNEIKSLFIKSRIALYSTKVPMNKFFSN